MSCLAQGRQKGARRVESLGHKKGRSQSSPNGNDGEGSQDLGGGSPKGKRRSGVTSGMERDRGYLARCVEASVELLGPRPNNRNHGSKAGAPDGMGLA